MTQKEAKGFDLRESVYAFINVIDDISGLTIAIVALIVFQFSGNERDLLLGLVGTASATVISSLRDRLKRHKALEQKVDSIYNDIQARTIHQISSADTFFKRGLELKPVMASSASVIWMCGVTLGETVRSYGETIAERLREKTEIRIMMLNTGEEALKELVKRSWSDTINVSDYVKTLEATANHVKHLANISDPKGSLEIAYLDSLPTCGLIMIDPDKTTGIGFVEYYGFRNRNTTRFLISKRTDPNKYRDYVDEFENLWASCKRVEKII